MVSNEKVSMNKDLKKWMHESKQNVKNCKNKKDETTKASGKCQICGVNKAEVVCLKCKRFVCKSCYFKLIGICKMCVPKDIAKKWDGSSPDWEKKLGIEWVE
jgi:hypothetical protein